MAHFLWPSRVWLPPTPTPAPTLRRSVQEMGEEVGEQVGGEGSGCSSGRPQPPAPSGHVRQVLRSLLPAPSFPGCRYSQPPAPRPTFPMWPGAHSGASAHLILVAEPSALPGPQPKSSPIPVWRLALVTSPSLRLCVCETGTQRDGPRGEGGSHLPALRPAPGLGPLHRGLLSITGTDGAHSVMLTDGTQVL